MNILKFLYLAVGLALTCFASLLTDHPIGMPVMCLGAVAVLTLCLRTKRDKADLPFEADEFRGVTNKTHESSETCQAESPQAEIIPFELPTQAEPRFDVSFEAYLDLAIGAPATVVELKGLTPAEVLTGLAPTPIILSKQDLAEHATKGLPFVREYPTPRSAFTTRGRRYRAGSFINKITIRPAAPELLAA